MAIKSLNLPISRTETVFGNLTFSQAFPLWINSRSKIAPATREGYKKNFRRMEPFFGSIRLSEITIDQINEYRDMRMADGVSTGRINKECCTLSQILKRAHLWAPIGEWYEPLALDTIPGEAGMALEPDEESHLFAVAATKRKWRVAFLASLLMRNTCLGFGELRMVTFANIDTEEFKWIRIKRGFKNKFRIRTVPCNEDAQFALKALFWRARKKGCYLPGHFLLPGRGPKPDVPMHHFPYKPRRTICKQAAKQFPRLENAVPYDMRRSACTNLMQNPNVSYNAIEALMGHRLGSEVKRQYDHIRDETIRRAADTLASGHPEKQREYVPKFRPNTTGFPGVRTHTTPSGKTYYRARIGMNGRRVTLGTYKTAEEAAQAYKLAMIALLERQKTAVGHA